MKNIRILFYIETFSQCRVFYIFQTLITYCPEYIYMVSMNSLLLAQKTNKLIFLAQKTLDLHHQTKLRRPTLFLLNLFISEFSKMARATRKTK